ncbi:MAG TPA: cytochrome c-type biogenesis protein [Acidimicrobiia bacterium]|nr:cytochrome c-type biogenesis protein [Acidimicrobiia bacterium]
MTEWARTVVALCVMAVALGVTVMSLATAEQSDADRVEALAERLKCPICASESIADSPSSLARDLYDLIAEQVADGWTDDEIVDFFVATYGEQVRLDPPIDARTIALWLVPLLGLAVGAAVILRRRSRVATRSLSEAERQRLMAATDPGGDDA